MTASLSSRTKLLHVFEIPALPPRFRGLLGLFFAVTVIQNYESVRRRTLTHALRFIAHMNGASLLFCSSKEKRLKDTLRQTLNTVRVKARSEDARSENSYFTFIHVCFSP